MDDNDWAISGLKPNSISTKQNHFDDIFAHVRSFGSYQRTLWVVFYFLMFPVCGQFVSVVFAFGTPRFHCATPNLTCSPNTCCNNCTEYEFDGPMRTTVSEWNLICDRAYLGATLQSCFFAGMLIGSLVSGLISDAWGRKKCFYLSYALMVVAGVSCVFVDCISFFAFLRFVVGAGTAGAMLSRYVLICEFVGPKTRTLIAIYGGFTWMTTELVNYAVAFLVRDWKMLLLIYTAPGVLAIFLWRWIPESPRWLLAHGYVDGAHSVIMKYGPKKGKESVDSAALSDLIQSTRQDQIKEEKESKKYTPLDMLRGEKLRKWTCIILYQWFAVSLLGFGTYIFVSQLAGDIYTNYFIMNGIGYISLPITWVLLKRVGRRLTHGCCAITAAVILFIMLAIHKDYPLTTTTMAIVALVIGNMNWGSIYLVTSELFPTLLRNIATGVGSTSARVGAIIAPYIGMTAQFPGLSLALPVTIFGAVALLNGALSYWLPETLFAKMHQTIEEAEAAKDYYGIPCCGRKPLIEEEDTKEPIEQKLTHQL
ncbi:organic cation transporter protein [Nematostella vectensis]|uniref:organic cation transporter protein n=1 Tax=Nematostella vectensis TaxID=45351 RepID=UPI002076F283|nr:organic cation transporter protein [Nematostella vectensis]